MRIPSALNCALAAAAILTAALLLGAGTTSAWGQQTKTDAAGRGRNVFHPPPPPRPIPIAPMPVAPAMAPPVQPIGDARVRPVPFTPPAIPRVKPIAISPASLPKPVIAGSMGAPGVRTIHSGAAGGVAPFRFPPESRRLATGPAGARPAKPLLLPTTASSRVSGGAGVPPPLPPPGSKVYCSPTSVMYNTGSICFNPSIETIDPAFFPWGLWSPPPFINVPGLGLVSPFVPGLLIQYCPQCVDGSLRLSTGPTPFGAAGLNPRGLPPDVVPNHALEITTTPEPPSTAPASDTGGSGPPVMLVLENGSMTLVSRYWLGQDWLLHFVTVTGERRAIPLSALNLKSTGAVNYARGVTFVLPGWPEPRAKD